MTESEFFRALAAEEAEYPDFSALIDGITQLVLHSDIYPKLASRFSPFDAAMSAYENGLVSWQNNRAGELVLQVSTGESQ